MLHLELWYGGLVKGAVRHEQANNEAIKLEI